MPQSAAAFGTLVECCAGSPDKYGVRLISATAHLRGARHEPSPGAQTGNLD